MGIDVEATCTPAVERKAVAASNRAASFAEAHEQLLALAGISLGPKRINRIVQRIGNERVAERNKRLNEYENLPLPQQKTPPPSAPYGLWESRVAVVFQDGGRAQLRDSRWGQARTPGLKKPRWWRESKISLLATVASSPQEADPLPDVPPCLRDPLWLIPVLNAIKAAKGGETAAGELEPSLPEPGSAEKADSPLEGQRWSPSHVVRTVVATFGTYDELGKLMKTEAYHRGFTSAKRKAFLGDGLSHNWVTHRKYFSDYTPIVDLMHALTYVYQAAKESTSDMELCWQRCCDWVTLLWQGNIGKLIEEIDLQIEQLQGADVLEKLHESRRYLSNNSERMRYAEYRQQGLPITTAEMESTVKRINRRIKGTEKFWSETAEAQLQLCTDELSETDPLTTYWQNRSQTRTGRRKSRTAGKSQTTRKPRTAS